MIAGLFECQDPSIESRNLSKGEFEEQIKEADVSREVNTCQGKAMSQQRQVIHLVLVSPFLNWW